MPKVTILVPVYNVENYLIQCMESLVRQTLKDIEIICIDDGSTDYSPAILDAYGEKYSFIHVIHKENTGYGHSMNTGLKSASGEYIGIVESDDFVEDNAFERLYALATGHDVNVVRSTFFETEAGIDIREKMRTDLFDNVFDPVVENVDFEFSLPIWNCIYKKEFLSRNRIWFNETSGASYQDISFGFKMFNCAKRIFFTEEAFYHHRIDNEASSINSSAKIFCVCDEFEEIWRFVGQRSDLNGTFKYRIPEYQYSIYKNFNYERIANEHKESFLIRMIEDFSKLEEKGLLNREYWTDDEAWLQVRRMIDNPEKVMYQNKIMIQNRHMFDIAFQEILTCSDKIFIYGAGKVGRQVARYLLKKQIKPIGFLVSDSEGQPDSVINIGVDSIETVDEEDRNALILVSVREADLYPIMKKLEQLGFKNVIAMTMELRKSISSK